jgi:hypothetical protein
MEYQAHGILKLQKPLPENTVFNLLDEKWDIDQLVVAARRLKSPVSVYQSYVRQRINNHFGAEYVYWSGFMGDTLAGNGLSKVPVTDKLEAIHLNFFSLESACNYNDQTFRDEMIRKILFECPWEVIHHKRFSLEQQLDLGIVARRLYQPTVIINNFNFKTPFLCKGWVNFMSNVPYKWLPDQYLQKLQLECRYLLQIMEFLSAGPSRESSLISFGGIHIVHTQERTISTGPSPCATRAVSRILFIQLFWI